MINENQRKAIDCGENCLITACPGSGKTTVLVNKAKLILSNPSNRLIGVTFSKDSANEFKVRLVEMCGESVLSRFSSGTFHGLAKRQLEGFDNGRKLRILSAHEKQIMLKNIYSTMGSERSFKDFLQQIETFKSTPFPDETDDDYKLFLEFQSIIKSRQIYQNPP